MVARDASKIQCLSCDVCASEACRIKRFRANFGALFMEMT